MELHYRGRVYEGRVRGYKGAPPKYDKSGIMVVDPMLIVTLELPNDPALVMHVAKLYGDKTNVDVSLEKNQLEIPMGDTPDIEHEQEG